MNESLGISMPVNVQRCVDTAQKVVNCIEKGEGERSSEAMREHLNIVGLELERGFLGQT
jgi:hypothetical protein